MSADNIQHACHVCGKLVRLLGCRQVIPRHKRDSNGEWCEASGAEAVFWTGRPYR